MNSRKAFTLIELLIVVAIIAILAAIAVPNFLEAQTRAKVSRVKADMRSISTGINAYMVDHNVTPVLDFKQDPITSLNRFDFCRALFQNEPATNPPIKTAWRLTTPIAYLTSISLLDPFSIAGGFSGAQQSGYFCVSLLGAAKARAQFPNCFQTFAILGDRKMRFDNVDHSVSFLLASPATDKEFNPVNVGANPNSRISQTMSSPEGDDVAHAFHDGGPGMSGISYDPTNGTVSFGDIFRIN
jgi:prepilin-type N-terminal cleavage/methylation domain-containing protein